MRRFRIVRRHGLTTSSTIVLAMGNAALAQAPGRVVEREGGWISWAVIAGVILVACMAGFVKAKRSHLH